MFKKFSLVDKPQQKFRSTSHDRHCGLQVKTGTKKNDVGPHNVVDNNDGRHVHRLKLVLAVTAEIQGNLVILDQQDKLLATKSGKSSFLLCYCLRWTGTRNFFTVRFLYVKKLPNLFK